MNPTPAYLSSPEIGRSRLEAEHGALRVVVENYSGPGHISGKSDIYLSTDGGNSFFQLNWQVAWTSWFRKLGREWPPHHVSINKLDEKQLQLSYFDSTYDGPVDYTAAYDFASKRWHLS